MAGYGNRTAPHYTADSLTDEHSSTRLGLIDSHNAPTYGAGLGNKRASQPTISPSSSNEKSVDTEDGVEESFHFNTQDTHGSAPYSNAHTYGSASTAGAGYGNKTGSFSSAGDGGGHKDSTMGRVMQKIGGVVHSEKIGEKGRVKREGGASGGDVNVPPAN
ncbi:hypothetical protein BU25DRAFT_460886 [Macroventuria anomochaeta]|uniref:Uncharacterized protein n=1 Tax=Macroventuria anomochaeta TaxID=301207 RepID=A0ACB6RUG7_9PLEO|nr:uncharacterized protein BU25DRAFT_460886 [Macroventuria anomochaeta]KAF2624713.1 hypothetical protein BU25DRAFT_460886 [Macroventuria anomochaeta]